MGLNYLHYFFKSITLYFKNIYRKCYESITILLKKDSSVNKVSIYIQKNVFTLIKYEIDMIARGSLKLGSFKYVLLIAGRIIIC